MTTPILTPEQLRRIHEATEKAVAAFISKIPDIVRTELTKTIMLAVGFREDHFSRRSWEVDNNNRAPIISDFIKQTSIYEVQRVLAQLMKPWLKELRQDKKYHEALQRNFLETYKRELNRLLDERAKAHAKADLENLLQALQQLRLDLPIINTELADPNSYQGIIGEAMLKRLFADGTIRISDTQPPDGKVVVELDLK